MRLAELHPTWTQRYNFPTHFRTGINFLCPCCRNIILGVEFVEPLSVGQELTPLERECWAAVVAAETVPGKKFFWHRTGDTFETLSLAPSVDASKVGHWHGTITNGAI